MLLFDAHLDLSMNALEWNRDLTRSVHEIREREQGQTDKVDRTRGTVALPDMRRGEIGICVATQIARYVKPANPLPGWQSPAQAWAQTQGQLSWYRAMEETGQLTPITDLPSLNHHLQIWNPPPTAPDHNLPIGYILSLEGADSIITLHHLERSYEQGLRALGPAHYGPGTYAQGTDATGGLGPQGRELLKQMERLNIILDVTHLCDDSFWEAIDVFNGPIWASHSNSRKLAPNNRQFSDEQFKVLIERGAVIGACLDAWMMIPDWIRGTTTPASAGLKLEQLLDHTDHVCQLAGNANHCGFGSDLDGGFGREQTPADLDTIADLQSLPELLAKRGFKPVDIEAISHENFLRFLRNTWAK